MSHGRVCGRAGLRWADSVERRFAYVDLDPLLLQRTNTIPPSPATPRATRIHTQKGTPPSLSVPVPLVDAVMPSLVPASSPRLNGLLGKGWPSAWRL